MLVPLLASLFGVTLVWEGSAVRLLLLEIAVLSEAISCASDKAAQLSSRALIIRFLIFSCQLFASVVVFRSIKAQLVSFISSICP